MSSLAISSGGRPLEPRSCPTIAPSFVDSITDPQIRTIRRAAAFSVGRQPEESVTRWNQLRSGDGNRNETVFSVSLSSAAALRCVMSQILVDASG